MEQTELILIKQGAEAKIYVTEFLGKQSILKERFSKTYRHPTLDATLCKERTTTEARSMMRCRAIGIHTPALYLVDIATCRIYMEHIKGSVTVREYISETEPRDPDGIKLKDLAKKIGETIGRLHNADIIHGDLTTSNMLLRPPHETSDVVMIDFGLSYMASSAEDKAVDLYVLERAYSSTHSQSQYVFEVVLNEYLAVCKKAAEIRKKLEDVRLRGRKRTMVG